MLPVSGVGARISGSTPAGGHNTPSDLASLSPSGSLLWPTVVPCGAIVPRGVDCVGAHSVARDGAGGAVWAGGVADVGATERSNVCFIRMRGERPAGADVPPEPSGFAIADEGKMPHRRHRPALGQADAAMLGCPVGQPRP